MNRSRLLLAALLTFALMAVTACGGASDSTSGSSSSGKGSKSLSLVAYSTPEVVYDEIIPAFQKTGDGKGVGFKTSFGASGEQSRAVEAGLKADVVTFSLEPDMTRLVKAGHGRRRTGTRTPNKGLVTTSVVVLHRPQGQPEEHQDLGRPAQAGRRGRSRRTRSPRARAKWNLLGRLRRQASTAARTRRPASTTCSKLITEHVKVQDKSRPRGAADFTGGNGDVLLSYEYEATTAQKKGQDVDYVRPGRHDQDREPDRDDQGRAGRQAKTFLDYVLSEPAQQQLRRLGLPAGERGGAGRRTRPSSRRRRGLFTIDDLGGWTKVNDELFDPDKGSIAKIEEDAGVSTAK